MDKSQNIDIGKRIKAIRTSFGLKQGPFGEKVGYDRTTISKVETGVEPASPRLIKAVCREFSVEEAWLGTGQGPKFRGERACPPTAELLIVSPEELRGRVEEVRRDRLYEPVPLVADRAAAGDPLEINDNDIEEYALVPRASLRPDGRYSCVRVRGRSMLPVLGEGDIVAVNHERRDPEELHRRLVAVGIEEGVTVKYLQVEPDRRHVVVYAENRAEWEPRYMMIDQVRIIGAVEWAWRRFE